MKFKKLNQVNGGKYLAGGSINQKHVYACLLEFRACSLAKRVTVPGVNNSQPTVDSL